jgi:hypothetical protein
MHRTWTTRLPKTIYGATHEFNEGCLTCCLNHWRHWFLVIFALALLWFNSLKTFSVHFVVQRCWVRGYGIMQVWWIQPRIFTVCNNMEVSPPKVVEHMKILSILLYFWKCFHYYKMWVQFISLCPRSLDHCIYCISWDPVHCDEWIHW